MYTILDIWRKGSKIDHAVFICLGCRTHLAYQFQILSLCRLFNKLVLEAPLITESALEVIRRYCEDEVRHTATSLFSPSSTSVKLCNIFIWSGIAFLGFRFYITKGLDAT